MPGVARPRSATAQPDRVDHHVLEPGPVDHAGLAPRSLAEARSDRCPSRRSTRESPCERSSLPPKPPSASSRARQSGVLASGAIVVGNAARSSSALRVNDGLILTSFPNTPTRARSSGSSRENSCAARVTQQRQIALHAAGDVQHHDQADGLRAAVVLRERLRLSVVSHLEVVAGQRRDEAPVPIRDGHEDPNGIASATKDLLVAASGGAEAEG